MMKSLKNVFEVTEQDGLGTAIIKGAGKGYLQGMLYSTIGLAVTVVGVKAIESYVEDRKLEERIDNLKSADEIIEETQDELNRIDKLHGIEAV